MRVQLLIDDCEFDLDQKSLEAIIKALPDTEENSIIFEELAKSPSARIRRIIASKHNLDDETYYNLLMDNSKNVFNELLENEYFLTYISQENLESLIDISDEKTLTKLSNSLTFMTEAVANHLPTVIEMGNSLILSKIEDFVTHDLFISNLNLSKLDYLIHFGDPQILSQIARDIDEFAYEFDICEMDWLCENLLEMDCFQADLVLADNEWTPVSFLKILSEHQNPSISITAKETLRKRNESEKDS
ncbi:hypothetical protein BuS5_01008 [Desulfosarcina sp. BuS5]|uniref:hypothetical protein n=1 Tax=Desulfosarcina sp. BuS5 TaxID=933262 RepID=UPI0004874396|nr:hypothetical protein [Desulfosarcina sp. BuS5]WDN87845.1 hypothetical protein BuS5_00813 [Desulfosarcina sp. BuS5]WDN88040.1 hypothetical protein BuS5_01008 [Desulfosarcina sp. BuS5]